MTEQLDHLRSILPKTALDPGSWPEVMRALEKYVGCSDLHLISINPRTKEMLRNLPLNATEAVDEFAEVVDVCEPVIYAANNPGWSIIKDQDFISPEEIQKSAFYDWATRYNATYRLGLRLLLRPDSDAHLWFLKDSSQGPVSGEDVRRLETVAAELRLAAQMGYELAGSDLQMDRFVETLENANKAAIVVGDQGNITAINKLARNIVRLNDGLGFWQENVICSSEADQREFNSLLATATRSSEAEHLLSGGQMSVGRPSGLPAYLVTVSALPSSEPFWDRAKTGALVLISDPVKPGKLSGKSLARAFGLTPAETRAALRFATGETISQIAEEQALSVHTVRTQFKSIMLKTGTTRQADLMRILTKYHVN